MTKFYIFLFFSTAFTVLQAQETFPVNGVHEIYRPRVAYTHLTAVRSNGETIKDATILVEDGKIKAIGSALTIPAGFAVKDLNGFWVYPSFIDLNSNYGINQNKKEIKGRRTEEVTDKPGALAWNEAIHPEINSVDLFETDKAKATGYLKAGFGMVLTHNPDGIARGTGALVSLRQAEENEVILSSEASTHYSFEKGSSAQAYPSSLMGSIALLRQTFYDANWYSSQTAETNLSLAAINANKQLPAFFDAPNILDELRADKLGDEFGVQFIFYGGGDEYQYLRELKNTRAAVVLPLSTPAAYEIKSAADVLNLRLTDMLHWEMAPKNGCLLQQNGIPFSISFKGAKSETEFKKQLKKLISCGLTEPEIINALTGTPASLLKITDKFGDLTTGKQASFFITDGNYFDENTVVVGHCLGGYYLRLLDEKLPDPRGKYTLVQQSGNDSMILEITGKRADYQVKMIEPDIKGKKSIEDFSLPYRIITQEGYFDLSLNGKNAIATRHDIDGSTASFTGSVEPLKTNTKSDSVIKAQNTFHLTYQYNNASVTTLIKDAQVWTSEDAGIKPGWDVLIENGKIKQIAEEIKPTPGCSVIDAKGKHLTPGLIDEHSHIAISRGVNEGTQAVTSEVRIADVVNPQDINIYRQLAGGVTTSHLLHGSANPIGGQTALIKLRYGASAEELKNGYPQSFIKFALGENVKQSNWGDNKTTRYPQTRMGVEQIIEDAFIRAKEYKAMSSNPIFRRDLELDALCEILEGKRFITCHSYQQGEINMLLNLADSLGFKVNTFTHILEGYKVADKMKAHGAAASTFADWWGYKFEVNEAIPYNAALLNQMGIVTAINSDDAEMGRRLNQEAAKAVKYGGVSETDALKMVTINPATMLHINQKTGSIKEGKDADLVLWNDHPLSVYSSVETTWVDGVIYFDKKTDAALRNRITEEKNRLWDAMHQAIGKGEPTQKPKFYEEKIYHCDDE